MRTRPSTTFAAITAVTALLVVACSGDDTGGADPTPPVPTRATTTTDAPATDAPTETTAPPATTVPDTTTATSTVPDTTEPAPETTAAATTVPAPPPTLISPAPLELDPDDPNNQRVIDPEHQPIIDAYIEATTANLLSGSEWPHDPNSPHLVSGPMTSRWVERQRLGLERRTELNQVLDVSGGVTLRPYVPEIDSGNPNVVFVWDCLIDATFWKDVETGEKAPPDAWPNEGPPGVEVGLTVVMVFRDGRWLMDDGWSEASACV